MVSTLASGQTTDRVSFARLLWVGPLAIVAAVIVNVLIQRIAVAVLNPDPGFGPLTAMPPVLFTVIGGLGAVVVFALVARFARRPIALYKRIALITLLVSLVPDVALLFANVMPGTNIGTIAALMLMHVTTWAICVGMLTRLTRA